jgi:signal transduction histidine kinase
VRRFVQDLRPSTLDHLGLVATFEGLTSNLKEKDGIEAELEVLGEARRLMPEEELVLFRLVQETLSNVRRHSGASQVAVQVEFHPGRVRIVIEDNGQGFSVPERMSDLVSMGKLGLVGMHERARTLGGTLTIQSRLGGGTTVVVDTSVKPGPRETVGSV